jgi:asparagine synthase (glutamine-hydrolysing)
MCGIFAFITLNTQIKSNFNKKFLNDVLHSSFMAGKNRGPESSRFLDSYEHKDSTDLNLDNSYWYLGFHRLAINGLTENGMQPFYKNGVYLICNGEIYNYKELYNEIGITDLTNINSDCLVILDFYIRYGLEYTISRLQGVFAFTIIDTNTNETHVVRDRIGIRSLYYATAKSKKTLHTNTNNMGETLIVASELKQLTSAVRSNICNPIYNDSKPLKPKHFPPGYFMTFDNNSGKNILKRYWSPYEHVSYLSNNNITKDELINTLFRCVKRRVESSEREVCCLLSGGLDSSLIASMVSRIIKEKGGTLKTFSIGMKGSDDLYYAKMVADYIGSEHTEVIVTNDEMFNAIPTVINALETYDTTTVRASVGNYLVCKYIRDNTNAKVVFNGDGADEVMGGYLYFQAIKENNIHVMERLRLLSEISSYDVLRSDKSIAGNGLEARTPYLDPEFIRDYFSCAEYYYKMIKRMPYVEKELIRNALKSHDYSYLPFEILERRKEAFSDGVSGQEKSWKDDIEDRINENNIKEINNIKFLIKDSDNKMTVEQAYYKDLFLKQIVHSNNLNYKILDPEFYKRLETRWMPRYVKATDPSARTLDMY